MGPGCAKMTTVVLNFEQTLGDHLQLYVDTFVNYSLAEVAGQMNYLPVVVVYEDPTDTGETALLLVTLSRYE